MLALFTLYILINLRIILIDCLSPPELTVSVLDERLIERKRQDTMDMCRIFTEETEKLEKMNKIYDDHKKIKAYRRGKRETNFKLEPINPALNADDALRVESIVDKMYDDLLEKGEKIDYRRGDLPTKKNISTNMSGRRFNFAPHVITGPLATTIQPGLHDIGYSPPDKTPRFKLSIVPYFIDQRTYDKHLAQMIVKAFNYFEKVTCIRLQRLRDRPTDKESLQNVEWLYITNPTGIKQCVHSNDRTIIKGVQMIVFGYNCMTLGDILHELMHILGFSHEHIRPDRDQYITILWENIKPGYRKYFELLNSTAVDNMPYDYASVLHYPPRAFSKNGQVTIMTEAGVKVGQREGLSEIDVEKVGALYSGECVKRNREYLLKTCPSVVRAKPAPAKATKEEIEKYYESRLWAYGIINYKLRDKMEFTNEERENIAAVIRHIEKETCIEFRDLTPDTNAHDVDTSDTDSDNENGKIKKKPFKHIDGTKDLDISGNNNNEGDDDDDENDESSVNKSISDTSNKTADGGQKTEDEVEQIKTDISSEEIDNEIEGDKDAERTKKNLIYELEGQSDNEYRSVKRRFLRQKKSLHMEVKTPKKLLNARMKKSKKPVRPISPARRHATNILVFTRTPKPGCACPKKPGVPGATAIVEISVDCFNSVNILLHLFMHILGLDHQHNSHDRDQYLHIVWDQLTEDVKKEMQKKLPPAASVGFSYDYQSVMHYPWLQIKNGRTNIMYPIWNDGWAMGHWQGLSSVDVQKINFLYNNQCELRREQAEKAGVRLNMAPK